VTAEPCPVDPEVVDYITPLFTITIVRILESTSRLTVNCQLKLRSALPKDTTDTFLEDLCMELKDFGVQLAKTSQEKPEPTTPLTTEPVQVNVKSVSSTSPLSVYVFPVFLSSFGHHPLILPPTSSPKMVALSIGILLIALLIMYLWSGSSGGEPSPQERMWLDFISQVRSRSHYDPTEVGRLFDEYRKGLLPHHEVEKVEARMESIIERLRTLRQRV